MIRNSWLKSAEVSIQEKLDSCGKDLDNCGRHLSHQIKERIKSQNELILTLKGSRDEESVLRLTKAEEELQRLLKCEESF